MYKHLGEDPTHFEVLRNLCFLLVFFEILFANTSIAGGLLDECRTSITGGLLVEQKIKSHEGGYFLFMGQAVLPLWHVCGLHQRH